MQAKNLFYTGRRGNGAGEVKFESEETAVAYAITMLKMEKWTLLVAYFGRKTARLGIGRIIPEIEEGWLTAVVLPKIKEDMKIT